MSALTFELVWGTIATVVLTAIMQGSQFLGLSRMSIPYILGTVFTSDRSRAAFYGVLVHFVDGMLFAAMYEVAFRATSLGAWWFGGLLGVVHTLLMLTVVPLLAGVHPRMATTTQGPGAVRKLQPPGFFLLNYGTRTPLVALLAHILYGVILGVGWTVRA